MKTFYFDENLSYRIGRAVRLLADDRDHAVVVVQDDLGKIKDPELLKIVGGDPDAFLLTTDTRMASRAQRDDLLRNRVGAFFLQQVSVLEQGTRILRAWPEIARAANECSKPFLMKVRQGGTLSHWRVR